MAVTRLPFERSWQRAGRTIEIADLRAAFFRIALARWGVHPPVTVRGIRRGALRLETSSAPWRTELLWSETGLCHALAQELPGLGSLRGISVFLH